MPKEMITWSEAIKTVGPIDITTAPQRERSRVVKEYFSQHFSRPRHYGIAGGSSYPPCTSCGKKHTCEACVGRDQNRYNSAASRMRKHNTQKRFFPAYGTFPEGLSEKAIQRISHDSQVCSPNADGLIMVVFADGSTATVDTPRRIPDFAQEPSGEHPVVVVMRPMSVEEVDRMVESLSGELVKV